jgi:hypothetical protein
LSVAKPILQIMGPAVGFLELVIELATTGLTRWLHPPT